MPGRDGSGPMGEGAGTGRGAGPCTGDSSSYGYGGGGRGRGRGGMRNRFRVQGGFRENTEQALQTRIATLQAEMEAIRKQLADLAAQPPGDGK